MALFTFKLPDIGEGIAQAEIVGWHVKVGDTVKAGQTLLILESMKMEIPLQAPCDGVVTHVLQQPGGRVQAGQPLVVLRDEALDTVA